MGCTPMFMGGAALDDRDPEQAVETRARIAPHVSSATVFFISVLRGRRMLTSVLRESKETLKARNTLLVLKNAQLFTGTANRTGL